MKIILVVSIALISIIGSSCSDPKPKKGCEKYIGTWHDRKEVNPGDTSATPGTLVVKNEGKDFFLELNYPEKTGTTTTCYCDNGRLINGEDMIPMENGKIYFRTRFFAKE